MPTEIERLAALFAGAPVAVLTGAGISTDSGIPDYRGTGGIWRRDTPVDPAKPPAARRTPMNIAQFMQDPAYRRRFWAGASVGARRTAGIEPNAGHLVLARLEHAGRIPGVITQNVDGLHTRAGSRTVVELHGSGAVIRCVACDRRYTRLEIVARFDELNPGFAERHASADIAPDGDAVVGAIPELAEVRVPECPACGGILRPDVVYFGELVPPPVFAVAEQMLSEAGALLIAGSSLAVNTGVRLVHRAERRGIPIAVINRGPTAIDARADLRIEGGTSETLSALEHVLG